MFCKILKRSFNNKSHEWNRKGSGRFTETPQAVKCVFKVNKERGKAPCLSSGREEIGAISNLPNTVISRHFLCAWWFNTECYFLRSAHLEDYQITAQQHFNSSSKGFLLYILFNKSHEWIPLKTNRCLHAWHAHPPTFTHHHGRSPCNTHPTHIPRSGNFSPRSLFSWHFDLLVTSFFPGLFSSSN